MDESQKSNVRFRLACINSMIKEFDIAESDVDSSCSLMDGLEEQIEAMREEFMPKAHYACVYESRGFSGTIREYKILCDKTTYSKANDQFYYDDEYDEYDLSDHYVIMLSEKTYMLFRRYKHLNDAYRSLKLLDCSTGTNYISDEMVSELAQLRQELNLGDLDIVRY